jgi:hypothetical protein
MLVASAILAAVGLVLPIAEFDVNTKVGPAQFLLESDFTQGTVDYRGEGSASNFDVNVTGHLAFIEGTGEYQERIGFLKGTAKERMNYIVPYTTDFLGKRAQLNVTVRTRTIPWWVVGVPVECEVEVEVVEMLNVSSLKIDRVFFEYKRTEGEDVLTKTAWEKDVGDALEEVGDTIKYTADLEVNEDWGKFELFGMVEVTMKDDEGVTATHVYKSYSTEPKTITLWTIPTGQGAKIALIGVSMPVTVVGIILAGIAVPFVIFDRRGQLYLAAGAGAGLLMGGLFFRIGATELATLVGYPDDLTFLGGYWVVLAAFVPAIVATGLLAWARFRYPPVNGEGHPGASLVSAPPEPGTGQPNMGEPVDAHIDDQADHQIEDQEVEI